MSEDQLNRNISNSTVREKDVPAEIVNPNLKNLTVHKITDRTSGFTQIDNRVWRGELGNLSSDARLALTVLLSLPEDWSLHIDHFNKICKFSKGKSRKARAELIRGNFLEVQTITVNGKIGYKYTVYELPKDILFQNPKSEIQQLKTESTKQETETAHINNKENKEITINKNYKKDNTNTCITKANAVKGFSSFNNTKASSNTSNKSKFDYINQESDVQPIEDLQATEKRREKRKTNEKSVISYITQSVEIDKSIKDDLVRFIRMRTEKGIRTTLTMFQELYNDLIVQCPTTSEQKQRIKYAISCGYPTFLKKESRNGKVYKSSTRPIFNIPEDDGENSIVEDFEI